MLFCMNFIFILIINFSIKAQNGIIDLSFGTNGTVVTTAGGEVFDMIIQPDDKIVVVGSNGSGAYDMTIMRFNADGSTDNTFGTNGKVTVDFNGGNDNALCVALQNDGKILVGGSCQQSPSNNNSNLAIIRLNTNGTLDNTFGTGGKYSYDIDGFAFDEIYDITIQSDGKIVAVGKGGTDMFNKTFVLRLNSNGSHDNSFDSDGILKAFGFPGGIMSTIYAVLVQPDGKILIAGSSTSCSLARLNSNGTIDNTFGTNGGIIIYHASYGNYLALQPDGKILLSNYNVIGNNTLLCRINSNGTLDNSFGNSGMASLNVNTGQYTHSKGIYLQSDGKILLSGSAFINGSTSDLLLAQYNSDGTLNTSFGPINNGYVTTSLASSDEDRGKCVGVQSNGKIILAGSPCTGSCKFALVRYNNTISPGGLNEWDERNFIIYPNPAKNEIFLSEMLPNSSVSIINSSGKTVHNQILGNEKQTKINVEQFPDGIYFILIKNQDKTYGRKLLISNN